MTTQVRPRVITRWLQKPSLLAFVAAAMTIVALDRPVSAQDHLSGDEVRKLITGNTLQGSFMTNPLTMVFYADGVVRGSVGMTGSDDGTWRIDGDKYCNQWVTYFNGVDKCYVWVPQGDDKYVLQNVDAFRGRNIQGRLEQGKPKGY